MLRLATIPAAGILHHARYTLKPITSRAWSSTAPRNRLDHESWHSWVLTRTKDQLKLELRQLGMPVSGNKAELVERLKRLKLSEKQQTISGGKVDIVGSPVPQTMVDRPAHVPKPDMNVPSQPASALSGAVKTTQRLPTEQAVQVDQQISPSQVNPPATSPSADSRDPIPPASQPDTVTDATSSPIAEGGIDEFNEDFVKMWEMKLERPKAATSPNSESPPIRTRERTPSISFQRNRNVSRRTVEPADRNGEGAVPALEQPQAFVANGTTPRAVDRVAAETTTTIVAAATTTPTVAAATTTTAVEDTDDVSPDEEWMTAFETKVSNRGGRSGVLMQQLRQLDATSSVGQTAGRSIPSHDAARAQGSEAVDQRTEELEREMVRGERVEMENTVARDETVDLMKDNSAVQGGSGRIHDENVTGGRSGLLNKQSPTAQNTHPNLTTLWTAPLGNLSANHPSHQNTPATTTTAFSSSDKQEYDPHRTKMALRDKVILSGIVFSAAAWWAAGRWKGKAGDREQETKTQAKA